MDRVCVMTVYFYLLFMQSHVIAFPADRSWKNQVFFHTAESMRFSQYVFVSNREGDRPRMPIYEGISK